MPQKSSFLIRTINPKTHPVLTAVIAAAMTFIVSPCAFADPPPATLFGNYAGAGKCPPHAKACTDTGALDNVYIRPMEKKKEPGEEKQLRESFQLPENAQADVRIAIRILRDYGQNCTLEGEALWSGDRLNFQDQPPYGAKICKLELRFNNDGLEIKDPGNICGWKFCSIDKPMRLAGRHFKKGPDQLRAAYKKSTTPPPAAIFGKYDWAGKCATDERQTVYCTARNKSTDYVIIKPSETADARVVIGRTKNTNDISPFCSLDADAMWLGNHLAFINELPDKPGSPQLLEFWFKDNTVVLRDVWNNHCGPYIQGAYFKKASPQPRHNAQH